MLPTKGNVFISVRDNDKQAVLPAAKMLADAGFQILATSGTFDVLTQNDIPATRIPKLSEGRPNIKDHIKNKKIQLIINTPTRKGPQTDEGKIRSLAVLTKVPIVNDDNRRQSVARRGRFRQCRRRKWGVQAAAGILRFRAKIMICPRRGTEERQDEYQTRRK